VARLEPVRGLGDDSGALDRLVRDGIVRPGHQSIPRSIVNTHPPALKKGASAVRALIEERRDGR
jgi:hypothetical protein